jgi:hypothetical protein
MGAIATRPVTAWAWFASSVMNALAIKTIRDELSGDLGEAIDAYHDDRVQQRGTTHDPAESHRDQP